MNQKEYDAVISKAQKLANTGKPELVSAYARELKSQGTESWLVEEVQMYIEAAIVAAGELDVE